jgi:hypothetical protein
MSETEQRKLAEKVAQQYEGKVVGVPVRPWADYLLDYAVAIRRSTWMEYPSRVRH